jgi:hypothetical protein
VAFTRSRKIDGKDVLSDLTELEVRYLRTAVRYRIYVLGADHIGHRETPPSGDKTDTIPVSRRIQLDALAVWFVQDER